MRIVKKSEIVESKYIIDKDNYNDMKHDLQDDDIVKIVDEEDETLEVDGEAEAVQEANKAIITKSHLIKLIKENNNAKK